MLHEAWQVEIERLTKDVGTAHNRMYLKYRDAEYANCPEPTPDAPKTGKPFIEVLDINPKVPCLLCGDSPCSCTPASLGGLLPQLVTQLVKTTFPSIRINP